MRAFFSSPYRSALFWPDRHHILIETVQAMRRLRIVPLKIIWHWHEAQDIDNCVWSPLIHGEIIRAGSLYHQGQEVPERDMGNWCLYVLRNGPWTHLVQAQTIPQSEDYRLGLKQSWMVREREVAEECGIKVTTDVELVHA